MCLVLFLPVEVVYFAEDLKFHQNSVKEAMKFPGNFMETDIGSSLQSFPMS